MTPAQGWVETLLEAIDAAEWDLAEGAQGDAGDPGAIANDLRELVAGAPEGHGRAFESLLSQLILGAGWTEAGALATPIVASLARTSGHSARPFALVLLAELVTGDHVPRIVGGLDRRDPQLASALAAPPAKDILDAVLDASDDLALGLRDADPRVRSATAFLLAFVSDRAARSYGEVEQAARLEQDLWTQASLFLALAHLSRYLGRPLATSTLEAWIRLPRADSPLPLPVQASPGVLTSAGLRAVAWLAGLRTDPASLLVPPGDPRCHDDLVELVRASDPAVDVFAWGRKNLDHVLLQWLLDRGEAGRVFASGVLADVTDEGIGPVDRHLSGALYASFEPLDPWPPRLVVLAEVDAGRRAVLETLSRREYEFEPFTAVGLTPFAWDRRRWLGSDAASVLERDARLDDGRTGQVWQRLAVARGRPGSESLARARERVTAELNEHLPPDDTDRLEAYALLALGAHGLHSIVDTHRVYLAIDAAGDAAGAWARAWLPRLLAFQPGNTRGSGLGTALVWALVRSGAGARHDFPPEYDTLLSLAGPEPALRVVLAALPKERREAVVVRELRGALASSWNGHLLLECLLALADLCALPTVNAAACELAEAIARESFLSMTAPTHAAALRDGVLARFG